MFDIEMMACVDYSEIKKCPKKAHMGMIVYKDNDYYMVVSINPIILQIIDNKQEEQKENHIGDYMLNMNNGLVSIYIGKDKVTPLSMNFAVDDYTMKGIRALANLP